jgi:glycine cleavage system H lipoate-binding protein
VVTVAVGLTFILLIFVDLVARWCSVHRAKPASDAVTAPMDFLLPSLQPDRFILPGGLFFHRGHTWVNVLFSGQVKVGVDDFVQRLLGRLDSIALPPVATEIREGQPFITIRQRGRSATLCAPLDGVVRAVNGELAKAPSLLKRETYTRGWLVALQPTNLAANLPQLTVGEGASLWLRAEIARLETFLSDAQFVERHAAMGATTGSVGARVDGLLEHLDDKAWRTFQGIFLAG